MCSTDFLTRAATWQTTETCPCNPLLFNETATSGQGRLLLESDANSTMKNFRCDSPAVPADMFVRQETLGTKTYLLQRGQHTVTALQRLCAELLSKGKLVPPRRPDGADPCPHTHNAAECQPTVCRQSTGWAGCRGRGARVACSIIRSERNCCRTQ